MVVAVNMLKAFNSIFIKPKPPNTLELNRITNLIEMVPAYLWVPGCPEKVKLCNQIGLPTL